MSTTTKNISLDFYNNNVVSVFAKQSDANSRFINVTCTDHGKKVFLNSATISAFIRMKKSDGKIVYNETKILDDGTILVTLTSQMLAVAGKQIADIMILSTPDISSEDLDEVENLSDVSVISVMSFDLIVSSSVVDNSTISSTDEFDALVQETAKLKKLETSVRTAETSRTEAEEIREYNEKIRISNENTRESNETTRNTDEATRQSNENARIAAEAKRQDDKSGEAYRIANETARQTTFSTTITNVETVIENAETATEAAKTVVTEFEKIKNLDGIIMQTEKGVANGVASLDSNGKVPSSQLNIANNLTTTETGLLLDASQGNELRLKISDLIKSNNTAHSNLEDLINSVESSWAEVINELPTIHFNSTVDDSIGKDGDILMIPISS